MPSEQSIKCAPGETERGKLIIRKKKTELKRPIESYEHKDKERVNNPPYGIKCASSFQPFVNQCALMNRRKA